MNNINKPECPICMNPISSPFYAHQNNGGKLHPFHKSCLKKHISGKRHANCPACRKSLSVKNMTMINTPNNKINMNNQQNGVEMNNNNIMIKVNRNNLGINRTQFLFYEPTMKGYFIYDTVSNSVVFENDMTTAKFIPQQNYSNFINELSNRTYISYDANSNSHFILPLINYQHIN